MIFLRDSRWGGVVRDRQTAKPLPTTKMKVKIMKSENQILFAMALAATISLNVHAAGQLPTNRALLSSPRTLEEFPELAVRGVPGSSLGIRRSTAGSTTSKLTTNHALAVSPRYIEEHPELARTGAGNPSVRNCKWVPSEVLRNPAFASSPRVLEQYPSLALGSGRASGSDNHFQIAPVK